MSRRPRAPCCGVSRCVVISPRRELKHDFAALRSRHDDSMKHGTACELDHRFDDLASGWRDVGSHHELPTIDGYFAAAEDRTKASYALRWRQIVVLAVICWAACGVLISSSRTPGTMMTACGRFPFS